MNTDEQARGILASAYKLYRSKKITKGAFESELCNYVQENGSIKDPVVHIEDEPNTDAAKSFVAAALPELKDGGVYQVFFLLGAHAVDAGWIDETQNGFGLSCLMDGLADASKKSILLMSFLDSKYDNEDVPLSDILSAFIKTYLIGVDSYPIELADSAEKKHLMDCEALKKILNDLADDDGRSAEALKQITDGHLLPDIFVTVINEQFSKEIAAKERAAKIKADKIAGLDEKPEKDKLDDQLRAKSNSDIGNGFGGSAGEKGGPSIKF
jgi:hypothetical protein